MDTTTTPKSSTIVIYLEREEQDIHLIEFEGKTYWDGASQGNPRHKFHVVEGVGQKRQGYIDADDRPFDHSHDGNGWQVWEWPHTVSAQAVDEELQKKLAWAQDVRVALSNVDAGYLAQLSDTERQSYVTAFTTAFYSKRDLGRYLHFQRDGKGGWMAAEQHERTDLKNDDDGLETL